MRLKARIERIEAARHGEVDKSPRVVLRTLVAPGSMEERPSYARMTSGPNIGTVIHAQAGESVEEFRERVNEIQEQRT